MALGERFTRSAVACEFSFSSVSRRVPEFWGEVQPRRH